MCMIGIVCIFVHFYIVTLHIQIDKTIIQKLINFLNAIRNE